MNWLLLNGLTSTPLGDPRSEVWKLDDMVLASGVVELYVFSSTPSSFALSSAPHEIDAKNGSEVLGRTAAKRMLLAALVDPDPASSLPAQALTVSPRVATAATTPARRQV